MRTATGPTPTRSNESGFALILAILALLLLTFLGLTIATSTSTELQIATNYRWGQQALYNAEAGLEAAKIILSNPPIASDTLGLTALPDERVAGAPWALNAAPPAVPLPPPHGPGATRNYENGGCDRRGGAIGYGLVLSDAPDGTPVGTAPVYYENVNTWAGQPLNGTFTIWIRRELILDNGGLFADSKDATTAVVTVEGTAPYTDNNAANAFEQSNRSVRIMETTLTLNQSQGITSCSGLEGQAGMSPQGDNFGCAMLDDTSVGALQP